MSIAFTYYAKIRNNYCISYYGLVPEYVVLLRYLRPYIKKVYPHLRIFISCRDEIMYLLEEESDIIGFSEIHNKKNDFAYIRELTTSIEPPHALETIILESLPNFVPEKLIPHTLSHRCLVCPDGAFPTQSYFDTNKICNYVESKGYKPTVVGSDIHPGPSQVEIRPGCDKLRLLDDTDWVIGVENEFIFEAIRRGIRTTLLPSGIGSNLYKLICPRGEILTL
jgi:hypothetical protein